MDRTSFSDLSDEEFQRVYEEAAVSAMVFGVGDTETQWEIDQEAERLGW